MKTEASEYLSLLQEIQNNNVSTFTVMPADEPRFTIETNSRNIIVPSEFSFLSVQNDHRAETIYFEIDRYFDNVDLSQHTCVVQFINKSGTTINEGTYPVISMDIDSIDGKIVFGWEIRNDATQLTGDITFSVRFYSIDNNGNFIYNFNTLTASSYILPSLNIIASGERITATELEVWTDKMNNLASSIESDIITVEEKIEELENYIASIPEDYTALTEEVSKLSEEIEEQKEVPMASINPYKMNLKDYDVVINEGRYVKGYSASTLKPTVTQNNTYDYDVIDMIINHDNCILTVPYDSTQNVGQAFVLYTEGVQANNATPNHVNNKQVGVIEVGTDSYTVNLNASKLNYERVAFTVPKGRRDFYFKNYDEGDLGKLIDNKIYKENSNIVSNNIVIAPVNMFYSIGAIGDSYTAGSALSSDGVTWQDVTELSWIATMAKRASIYYSNYGKGGATTKSYITDKLPSVLSGQAKDLYFIGLGINDYMQNISVGAISDIKNDYTQNGETFYGYYGSIIAQVQAHAPKAKIVLVKIWTDGTSKIPYDNAITEIASHFGLPVIDPFDDIYFNSSLYLDNMVSGHPTAMGYACMGLAMERLFSKCVIENSAYFKFATIG